MITTWNKYHLWYFITSNNSLTINGIKDIQVTNFLRNYIRGKNEIYVLGILEHLWSIIFFPVRKKI